MTDKTDREIIEQADERIERYRKGDMTILASDSNGKPLKGARVEISQQKHAFKFGSNIFMWHQNIEAEGGWQSEYRQRYADLLNYATLPFYWGSFEPERGKPRYEYIDQVVQWCQENDIACKGHPLVWNHPASSCRWLPEEIAEVKRLSDNRVADCVARYKGKIDIWDVVNEAVDPGRFDKSDTPDKPENMMTKAWMHYGQLKFTVEPFLVARQANPHSTLLINDYRVDPAYEELIAQLQNDGERVYDVIGIQSHMHRGAWSASKIWEVCERFQKFGVPLHFTETTIVSGSKTEGGWETTPDGEQKQLEDVEMFYTTLFSHPAVEAITWWDFSDRGAWQEAPAGFLRKDMTPKPVYEKLMSLIKGKWWTKSESVTDDRGKVSFRGFYGDYKVVINSPDGKRSETEIKLKFGSTNQFVLS